MTLLLSKFIPPLLFPAGLTILLCLLAAWLAFRARAFGAGLAALLAAVVLYAGSSTLVTQRLVHGLEAQNPPLEKPPKAAAIVLLGGGMMAPSPWRLHPETNWAGDRLLYAARLWKEGHAPKIVATGGFIHFMTGVDGTEAELYEEALVELFDVPASSILKVGESRTTDEDAALAARLFDSTGMKKEILLVTSATHMPRAAALFRREGFTVIPAPTDFYSGGPEFKIYQLLPSAKALAEGQLALHEYLGAWAYRMRGRL